MRQFNAHREELAGQYQNIRWIRTGCLNEEELRAEFGRIEAEWADVSMTMCRAKCFELIAVNAPVAIDPEDIFQEKVFGGGLMADQRKRRQKQVIAEHMAELDTENSAAWRLCGAYRGQSDFGHTSPNSRLLLSAGFPGLLERAQKALQKIEPADERRYTYESWVIAARALITAARRLAAAVRPVDPANADVLEALTRRPPENTYEAMQLLILYFFLHEYTAGIRVRTLGRLDVLLAPFVERDMASGKYTREDIAGLMRFFLNKFCAAQVPFNLPFCLGGAGSGGEASEAFSLLLLSVYREMKIISPKIHVRVSGETSDKLIRAALDCIRGGCSSIVFVCDDTAVATLEKAGIRRNDALDYVPIGCYEPAVWGVECGCTGNGGVNLAKAVELVLNGGRDRATGQIIGPVTDVPGSYPEFYDAVKERIRYMAEKAMEYIVRIEKHYAEIAPDPLLSVQYDNCLKTGRDVFCGGAAYNNSSLSLYGIATLTDALCAVKHVVFDERLLTLAELGELLRADWKGGEELRTHILRTCPRYGRGDPEADLLAAELAAYLAGLVNHRPNGRGGVFKASLFTIDHCFRLGALTMATPDGRRQGEPLSKNLCASVQTGGGGVTSLISSAARIDHTAFPNGSVLDVVLHPSAVSGEDGLTAMEGVLKTYFYLGGLAMHFNVFSPEQLREAQSDPEKYASLQVRLCGWNVYFNELSRTEQDSFIMQAENE